MPNASVIPTCQDPHFGFMNLFPVFMFLLMSFGELLNTGIASEKSCTTDTAIMETVCWNERNISISQLKFQILSQTKLTTTYKAYFDNNADLQL